MPSTRRADREDLASAQSADRSDHERNTTVLDERTTTPTTDPINGLLRGVAVAAGGLAVVIAAVALIRIDWNDGLSSAPAEVLGLAFTPVVALATLVLGLIAMAVGAGPGRSEKLGFGAVLVCGGLAILIAGDSRSDLDLESGHGWLALLVGVVLVVTGALMRNVWRSRRSVRADGYQA